MKSYNKIRPMIIANDDILRMCEVKGYEIVIDHSPSEDPTCSGEKIAVFKGRFSTGTSKPKLFTDEFTDEEIRLQLAEDLMNWAGLHLTVSLEY